MPPIYPGVAHQFALLSLVVFSKKIVKKYCKNKLCCAPHILYPGVADKFALLSLGVFSKKIVKNIVKNNFAVPPIYPGVADKFALLSLVISSQQQSRFLHKWRH